MQHSALLNVMIAAARKAARAIKRDFGELEKLQVSLKSPANFVTAADRRAEETIYTELIKARPGYGFLGEETGRRDGSDKSHMWIVDPLDGTTNFLHGYPEYSVSIAIARDGILCAGVVLNVPREDEFTARRGGGAFLNGKRIHVSALREPNRSLIGTGFPFKALEKLPQYLQQFSLVMRGTAGIRRAGSAALDMSNVACGRFDAFWELVLAPWDVAAGVLMVQEAGGIVTDLEGNPPKLTAGSFVAGNPAMHAWLLQTVRRANMNKEKPE